MKRLLLLLLALILCLTACGAPTPTDETKSAEPDFTQEEDKPEEPELTQEEIVNYMSLTYVNENPDATAYPVETNIVLPGRHFVCEDTVSNPAEYLVYQYFYAIGTGDYDYLLNHLVGSDLNQKMLAVADSDINGIFYDQVTVHEMELVPIEQFLDFQYGFCEEVATLAGGSQLTEYTVVKARASYSYNELSMEMNPDLTDGEVTFYIFVGRTDGDYFLFNIYGRDYVE